MFEYHKFQTFGSNTRKNKIFPRRNSDKSTLGKNPTVPSVPQIKKKKLCNNSVDK